MFSAYHDDGSDSSVMAIIRRHETLTITNQDLLQRLGCLEEAVEKATGQLQSMKQEHSVRLLVRHAQLCRLKRFILLSWKESWVTDALWHQCL